MDDRLCVPQESRTNGCTGDSPLFEIEAIRGEDTAQIVDLVPLYGAFLREVQGECLSEEEVIEHLVKEIRTNLTGFKLCYLGGIPAGFIMARDVFGCLLIVRGLYFLKKARGVKLGLEMLKSYGPNIREVWFQTKKLIEPERMKELAFKHSELVFEDEYMSTWRMKWGF